MAITQVDDRSSTISYVGGWGRGGATIDYNGSVTYATVGGQTATLTFRGTGIGVYGHIMAQSPGVPAPVSTYSIDGGNPTIYNEVQDGTEHPNQQFYQSPALSNGQHTIVVTNSFSNHAAFFLDYFLVVTSSDPPSPTPTPQSPQPTTVTTVVTSAGSGSSRLSSTTTVGSPSAPSSAIRSSSSPRNISTSMVNGTVVTVTIAPSSGSALGSDSLSMPPASTLPSNAGSTSTNLRIHPGIIIGSCVGGVVTIVLSAIIVYFCLRKRRRDEYDWRKVSGFSNQPHSSEWQQQTGRIQSKLSRSYTQRTETETDSHDHLTFAGRPPSYSQVPPSYNPAHAPSSSTQSPQPSKLAGFF